MRIHKLILILFIVLLAQNTLGYIQFSNSTIQSVGLNSSFNISTHFIWLDELQISPSSIYFVNLTRSTTQTSNLYNVTFNYTESNHNYTNEGLPYVIGYGNSINIISGIEQALNLTFLYYNFNCTDVHFNYTSANNTYNRQYLDTDYTCNVNTSTITVMIEEGTNIFSFEARKYVSLIDEITNTFLNLDNVTQARLFYDDNRTLFDFKTANVTQTNFSSIDSNRLRLELEYSDGTIITRYIDVDLFETDVRICANGEGTTHYEQLITASTEKRALLRNIFSNCYVAADYTRWAYQNSKVLKAFTVAKNYELITYDSDDNQIVLAAVDGSIASYINIDTLEFYAEGYNIDLSTEDIAISKRNDNEMTLYYLNQNEDNDELRIQIERMDTDVAVYDSTSYADPNEVTIIFNHATLSNVTDETVFKVTVTSTDTSDDVNTFYKYFNTETIVGFISASMIAVISVILLMFGLSFTITQASMGWFGVFIQLFNIALLTFATLTWYITFLMAVNAIVLVYIILILTAKNKATIG